MRIQFRKANGFLQRTTELYEWSPNDQKWYTIHRGNILALGGVQVEREILNAALQGETVNLHALYLKHEKLLLLARD